MHLGIQGMVQFPEDVKLIRDALALLGHIASVEASGHTFLMTHKLYLGVMAALQRHASDIVVAVSEGIKVIYWLSDVFTATGSWKGNVVDLSPRSKVYFVPTGANGCQR